jgi:hypothetical protein
MALNLADRIAVRRNIVDRCTGVVVSYAIYILGNQAATGPQLGWAREAVQAPGVYGERASWHVVGSQAFIDNGSGISDNDLDYLVQTAVNAHFIAGA